jgi:hypothetical protein
MKKILVLTVALLLSTLLVGSFLSANPAQAQETHPNPPPVSSQGAAFPPGTVLPGASCDNVERGNLGWTETIGTGTYPDKQPLPGKVDISTWHITALNSFSPTHSWWIGNEHLGSYDTGLVHRILTSFPIVVSGPKATLSYNSFYKTIETASGYDAAVVWVKTSSGLLPVYGMISWGAEDGAGWLSFAWDISSLAGQTISIVLEFNTYDAGANTGPGWFVDDICVTGDFVLPAVGGTIASPSLVTIMMPLLPFLVLAVVATGAVAIVMRKRYAAPLLARIR